jgi:hypothetical protein
MKRLSIGLMVMVLGVFLTGFIRSPQTETQPVDVTVTLKEFKVVLSRTNLPAGVPIRFIFKNMGTLLHEAVLEKAGAVDEPLEFSGEAAEVEDIDPGSDPSVVWTINEAGAYQLACHIAGHFEGGMVAKFNIRAGAAWVSSLYEYAGWIMGGIVLILLVLVGAFVALRRKSAAAGA